MRKEERICGKTEKGCSAHNHKFTTKNEYARRQGIAKKGGGRNNLYRKFCLLFLQKKSDGLLGI